MSLIEVASHIIASTWPFSIGHSCALINMRGLDLNEVDIMCDTHWRIVQCTHCRASGTMDAGLVAI